MRSVDRGPWPRGNDGLPVSFSRYRDAKPLLIERIGEYCSYCERPGDLHVEHVVPVSVDRGLEAAWTNFLLGCVNCNSRKSNHNASRDGYLWPDRDDTFGAFVYRSGGRVSVNCKLSAEGHDKASALFDLLKLGATKPPTDRRRHKRRQAWDQAVEVRRLVNGDRSRRLAIEVAKGTGYYSVWMAVFHDDDDMRRRLAQAFPGTRAGS